MVLLWLFIARTQTQTPKVTYSLYSISRSLEVHKKHIQAYSFLMKCNHTPTKQDVQMVNGQVLIRPHLHHNRTETDPSSALLKVALAIFWLTPPALSFPSNQLQSVAGMEGEITLGRHHGEISAQPRHYLVLSKHPRGNLCQTTRLQHVHTGQRNR